MEDSDIEELEYRITKLERIHRKELSKLIEIDALTAVLSTIETKCCTTEEDFIKYRAIVDMIKSKITDLRKELGMS